MCSCVAKLITKHHFFGIPRQWGAPRASFPRDLLTTPSKLRTGAPRKTLVGGPWGFDNKDIDGTLGQQNGQRISTAFCCRGYYGWAVSSLNRGWERASTVGGWNDKELDLDLPETSRAESSLADSGRVRWEAPPTPSPLPLATFRVPSWPVTTQVQTLGDGEYGMASAVGKLPFSGMQNLALRSFADRFATKKIRNSDKRTQIPVQQIKM